MIALDGIRKRFGQTVALDGVSLQISAGEIHALLGENGAGKTTLMKILYGLLRPDAGDIRINGRAVSLRRPEAARRLGIGMVHQHFMLVERMTVAQNVVLGDRSAGYWLAPHRMNRVVADAARGLGLEIDPVARVEGLSVGQRQRVELLKVLRRPVRVLILDEPTAVLAPAEIEALFGTLQRLRSAGCAIVFITHKLAEAMRLCDRVTILRRGRTIATQDIAATSAADLATQMVGEEKGTGVFSHSNVVVPPTAEKSGTVTHFPSPPPRPASEPPILELLDVSTPAGERPPGLSHASVKVHAGEIIGIAGVDGNGQAALVETILGLRRIASGSLRIPPGAPAHVADDRQREALVPALSVAENAVLKSHAHKPFSHRGILRWPVIRAFARDLIAQYAIRAASERAAVADLSGGNQQKLVVGREFSGSPTFILAVNPTRGLDIVATDLVRRALVAHRDRGAAILLVSSDLDEILALSTRVLVMYRGHLHPTAWPIGGIAEIAARMAGITDSASPPEVPGAGRGGA